MRKQTFHFSLRNESAQWLTISHDNKQFSLIKIRDNGGNDW